MDRERSKDGAAAFLVVIAPLLIFLHELDYGVLSSELALFVLTAALVVTLVFYSIPRGWDVVRAGAFAGVIVLFIDFQFELIDRFGWTLAIVCILVPSFAWISRRHLPVLLLVFFGAFNLATLMKFAAADVHGSAAANEGRAHAQDLPLFIHLVLDEHIGIEGIPVEIEGGAVLADELRAFYLSYGFRVHGGAHSSYFGTVDSFATFLNLDRTSPPNERYAVEEDDDGLHYTLQSNLHFQELVARGYRLRVYQTSYLDLCRDTNGIESCYHYPHDRANRTELSNLGFAERIRMIARMYGNFSYCMRKLSQLYRSARTALGETGASLPEWSNWDGRVSAMAAMPVIDKVAADIEADSGDVAYFAHLLTPHYPYIYHHDCSIRAVSEWRNRYAPESRALPDRRYQLYFEQVRCTMERTRALFDRLKAAGQFDDAVILIHGDHGSRIMSVNDLDANSTTIAEEDLRAGFSTLFAVKVPGRPPGYDSELRSITSLLRESVSGALDAVEEDHHIYLQKKDGSWASRSFPVEE